MKYQFIIIIFFCFYTNICICQTDKIKISINTHLVKNITNSDWLANVYGAAGYGLNVSYEVIKYKKVTLSTGLVYNNTPVRINWGRYDPFGFNSAVEYSRVARFSVPINIQYSLSNKSNWAVNFGIDWVFNQQISRKLYNASNDGSSRTKIKSNQEGLFTDNNSYKTTTVLFGVQKGFMVAGKKFTIGLSQITDLQKNRLTETINDVTKRFEFRNSTTQLSLDCALSNFF